MEVGIIALALITFVCGRSVCFEDTKKQQKKKAAKEAKRLGEVLGDYLEQVVLQERLSQKS